MEKGIDFDLGRLLIEKKHKPKPMQFVSVASGVRKRLQQNIIDRRSSRLTTHDNLRNLAIHESPAPTPDKKSTVEHRRLQLEKWKQEKEQKKKEAALQKKKPFLLGAAPAKSLPPAPPVKPMPSTSGRVTRSQSAKQNIAKQKADAKQAKSAQSFAPKNASFQAPKIKNLTVLPTLAPAAKKKDNKNAFMFNPVLPNTLKQNVKQTRSRTFNDNVESRTTRNTTKDPEIKSKGKVKKPSPKRKILSKTLQSSSSSEIDASKSLPSIREVEMQSSTESEGQISLQSSSSSEVEMGPKKTSPILRNKTPKKSLPKSTKLTPKNPVPKSESSSEEKLRSPKSPVDAAMAAELSEDETKISPCVTMSRGKDNARKEMKKKMDEGLLDEDTSDIDSVNHFRRQLASEIKRMTEMCEVWDKILEQTPLSESIQELVLAAVGQARLLMSKKLRQFAGLVETCARPEPGAALVTPADLAGFWDMVFMQIENIDMRFKKLEDLKKRGWVEEVPVEAKKTVVPKNNTKKVAKPAGGSSRLRDMIAAARKAKQQGSSSTPEKSSDDSGESKTFEAGFFCVRSPVRSPADSPRATPKAKTSLLKAVLSSEAKKSASKNSSFAMLRASLMSKNTEYDGISLLPQTPINLNATPSRSILKSANKSVKKSSKKSIKVVLFDDSDNNIQEKSDSSEEPFSGFEKLPECNIESGLSLMEKEYENKENSRRKSKLVRQDAVTDDVSGVMTRSRRKSMNTPKDDLEEISKKEKTPKRSSRKKKALHEADSNVADDNVSETPKRSTRSRRSLKSQNVAE